MIDIRAAEKTKRGTDPKSMFLNDWHHNSFFFNYAKMFEIVHVFVVIHKLFQEGNSTGAT
jgi:hypothetical protein